MSLTSLSHKFANDILFIVIRRRQHKHYKRVASNIGKLFNFHAKGIKYDFSAVRKQLLKDILIYARKNTAYYKEILPDSLRTLTNGNLEFSRIPFLTKDIIRTRSKALLSDIVPPNCLSPRKTGGSTGDPLAFWTTGNTDGVHQKFLIELYNYKHGDKILAIDGTFLEDHVTEKGIFWKIKNKGNMLPYGGMALSALYLTKETISKYVDFILSYEPQFIRGYPASITEIAQYMISNGIPVNFKMKGIR